MGRRDQASDCEGPVTVTSEDQVATGAKAVFDREKDLVIMTGNVALAKGPNITRGERLVYNTKTGIANVKRLPGAVACRASSSRVRPISRKDSSLPPGPAAPGPTRAGGSGAAAPHRAAGSADQLSTHRADGA